MANYDYITATGTIVPDTVTLQTDVGTEYKDAFGQDLVVDARTPQGALITMEVLARAEIAANNAALANQINPNIAGGIFFDAIWALTGGARRVNLYSFATCTVAGEPNVVIPALTSQIKNATGDIFAAVNTIYLDSFGNGPGVFQEINPGAILAPAGTLNSIVEGGGVLGWETVTNPNNAAVGQATQSDPSARLQRRVTLALQASGQSEAITSALYATDGVTSLKYRENVSPSTQVIDGITMIGHSLYVCVAGGVNQVVADTLASKKDGGCAYNGSTAVTVTDPFSGQVSTVLFDRPTLLPILIRATVEVFTAVGDPQVTVKQALLDYINGLIDGEPGLTVGASVSCFELAGAINNEVPGLYVKNLETTLATLINYSNAEIPIAINQQATCNATSLTVVVVTS